VRVEPADSETSVLTGLSASPPSRCASCSRIARSRCSPSQRAERSRYAAGSPAGRIGAGSWRRLSPPTRRSIQSATRVGMARKRASAMRQVSGVR
jgi:hypothetical protein